MDAAKALTLLRPRLAYDPLTGIFTWKQLPKNTSAVKLGSVAGSYTSQDYIMIRANKKGWLAHRLAWLFTYGDWPSKQIDHINGVRDDNRIANLRDASNLENMRNQPCHRAGKVVGIHFNKRNQNWNASIGLGNGKRQFLGVFATATEAALAYQIALKELA